MGQLQPLLQFDDVDAALLQDDAACEVDGVHGDVGDAVGDKAVAWQEGGSDPPSAIGQAKVERGGLNLVCVPRGLRGDGLIGDQGFDGLTGQDAGFGKVDRVHAYSHTRHRPEARGEPHRI